jgi:hypothetical protein
MRRGGEDMGPKFFQTRMGQRYYESTIPKLVEEVSRLADNIAALNETIIRWVAGQEAERRGDEADRSGDE